MTEHEGTGILLAIGRLEGKMDGACSHLETLDTKMDALQMKGCAVGITNKNRITALEKVPRRAALTAPVTGASAAGIIIGLVEGIKAWIK